MNWRAYVVPGLLLTMIVSLAATYYEGRKAGEYAVRLRDSDAKIAHLNHQLFDRDTLYVPDSTAYHALLRKYLALQAKGKPATPRPVTTPVSAPVVGSTPTPTPLADSVIQACSVVVISCEARVAVRDSLIAALNDKVKILLHPPHSFFSGVGGKAVVLGLGFLIGRAVH